MVRHGKIDLLRRRPEIIFIPTIVIWLIVNIPPWQIMGGQSLALLALKTGALGGPTFTSVQDEIFPLTYTLAWVSIAFSLFIFKFRIKLEWVRGIIMSTTFPFAFVGSFEEIWQNLWVVRGLPPPLANEIWMISWTLTGFSTIHTGDSQEKVLRYFSL
jgi:hypothetical protein